jgi:hypothetical protein
LSPQNLALQGGTTWAAAQAVYTSLAASPALAGAMLAASGFGWPLVLAGGLKAAYDLLLLVMFGKRTPAGGDGQTPLPVLSPGCFGPS